MASSNSFPLSSPSLPPSTLKLASSTASQSTPSFLMFYSLCPCKLSSTACNYFQSSLLSSSLFRLRSFSAAETSRPPVSATHKYSLYHHLTPTILCAEREYQSSNWPLQRSRYHRYQLDKQTKFRRKNCLLFRLWRYNSASL